MSTQLADSHLTYVGAASNYGTRYDVYHRYRRGPQLGWVERRWGIWEAFDFETQDTKRGNTRWQVATALWGDAA